jgi:hypothetical protein
MCPFFQQEKVMEKFVEQRSENMKAFLESYFRQKYMAETPEVSSGEDTTTTTTAKAPAADPYDKDLAAGQIRVLAGTERITYVLVLGGWGPGAWLIMPFSWYSFPATDGEFKTEFDGGLFLRVLQPWNARTLLDETLEKSWVVGELPEKDMEDAWKFWQYTIGQGEIDDELLQRSGLPIAWDRDPRLQYERDELANFAKIDAEDLRICGIFED